MKLKRAWPLIFPGILLLPLLLVVGQKLVGSLSDPPKPTEWREGRAGLFSGVEAAYYKMTEKTGKGYRWRCCVKHKYLVIVIGDGLVSKEGYRAALEDERRPFLPRFHAECTDRSWPYYCTCELLDQDGVAVSQISLDSSADKPTDPTKNPCWSRS